MTDLTKGSKQKPQMPQPRTYFLIPMLASIGLWGFWLFALTHWVDLGPTAHGRGGQSSAFWFNFLLLLGLGVGWIVATCLYFRKKDNS